MSQHKAVSLEMRKLETVKLEVWVFLEPQPEGKTWAESSKARHLCSDRRIAQPYPLRFSSVWGTVQAVGIVPGPGRVQLSEGAACFRHT